MSAKRAVLSVLVLGICASAPTPTRAATEVEGAAYGGSTAGAWICGPVGRANYAGAGARVRYKQRPASATSASGWTADVGGAAEFERTRIIECEGDCDERDVAPPDAVLFGAQARGGYRAERVGLTFGPLLYQGWGDNNDTRPELAIGPAVEVEIGRETRTTAVLGIGSPLVTTYRRPGVYGGTDIPTELGTVQLRAGVMRGGPSTLDDVVARADLVWNQSLTRGLDLRIGGSVSGEEVGLGAEGSLGLRGRL